MHVHAKTKEMRPADKQGNKLKEKHAKWQTDKKEPNGGKQSMLSIWKGKQACYQTKEDVLGGKM